LETRCNFTSSIDWDKFVKWGDLTAARLDDKGVAYRRDYGRGVMLYYLVKLLKPERVVDVGTGRGYSAVCMLEALRSVHPASKFELFTVDTNSVYTKKSHLVYSRGSGEGYKAVKASVFQLMDKAVGMKGDVKFCKGESKAVLSCLRPGVGFVFVDGSHDFDDVMSDCSEAFKILDKGGVVVFHDYGEVGTTKAQEQRMPEVTRAIDKCIKDLSDRFDFVEVYTDGRVVENPSSTVKDTFLYRYEVSGKMGSLVCFPREGCNG